MAQHQVNPFTDVDGYHHIPAASTVGIIYNNHNDGPAFFRWIDFFTAAFHPPLAAADEAAAGRGPSSIFRVASSSRGLVAFRRTDANLYYVGNPFVPPGPNSYIVLQPTSQHDPSETHVILATDEQSDPRNPVFRLICACHLEGCVYRFDVYSSRRAAWRSVAELLAGNIIPNSGISCGRGRFAYFLEAIPGHGTHVFKFDTSRKEYARRERLPISSRVQLSRGGDQVYAVAVNKARRRVESYRVGGDDNGIPDDFFTFHIQEEEEEVGNNGVNPQQPPQILDDQCLVCSELPWPIRAESFKMEVLLWVDGRVVLWERRTGQPQMSRVLLLPLQPEAAAAASFHIADGGIAHVNTALVPGIFGLGEEDDERGVDLTWDWDDEDYVHAAGEEEVHAAGEEEGDGVQDHPKYSMTRVIFTNREGNTDPSSFLRCRNMDLRPLVLPRIIPEQQQPLQGPQSQTPELLFTACSSSCGLVAFRRNGGFNIYYLGNPFDFSHDHPDPQYIPLPPPPRPHTSSNAQVVLCTSSAQGPDFFILCAVAAAVSCAAGRPLGRSTLIFDGFFSGDEDWVSYTDIDLGGREIMPNTGVACDSIIYWLTRTLLLPSQYSVFRFDVFSRRLDVPLDEGEEEFTKFWDLPSHLNLNPEVVELQLGTVLGNRLGIVALIGGNLYTPRVELYLVQVRGQGQGVSEPPIASITLRIQPNLDWNNIGRQVFYQNEPVVCSEMPRAVRFESFKLELVLLQLNGRVLFWESNANANGGGIGHCRVVSLLQPAATAAVGGNQMVVPHVSLAPEPLQDWAADV